VEAHRRRRLGSRSAHGDGIADHPRLEDDGRRLGHRDLSRDLEHATSSTPPTRRLSAAFEARFAVLSVYAEGDGMSIHQRHNVHVRGTGETDMVFAHGFGCDQTMWRFLSPAFESSYRMIFYDLIGSGGSDLGAYDVGKYGTLEGHARDVLEIIDTLSARPVVFVGHSVSAMIGVLAAVAAPERFRSQIMIGPSPCYINDEEYVGGFTRGDIESLLDTLDSNYLGWASAMAPAIMGAPDRPALGEELTNSFCRTDPEIAKHFARVTFLGDNRADLTKFKTPSLILQCSEDIIAPRPVGEYLHRMLPNSSLRVIENIGHCPHLSAPEAIGSAMREFLAQ
jgi:sigma-B regulation protein RsbQ